MTARLATDPWADLRDRARRHPALAHVAAGLAAYEGGRTLTAQLRTWYTQHCTYTVTVRDTDRIYDAVLDWLMELLPTGNQRRLVAGTSGGARYDLAEPDQPVKRPLRIHYADDQTLDVTIDGHPVKATLSAEDSGGGGETARRQRSARHVELRCRSKAAQEAVLRHLQAINDDQGRAEPTLWMTGMWGDWQKRSDLPARTLDSVILPADQKTAIVEDLAGFLAAEQRYNDLAIPWHRGYMFHGPPGTGKTSLAKALATEFRMDLWYISLADLRDTSDLMSLIRGVRPRSILLLEDIDTARITHDRDTTDNTPPAEGTVSLTTLLNALDGVATPHGLITIMTTNHLDKLDDALTRAGRMDRIEELGLPGPAEVAALFHRFYGQPLDQETTAGLSQAELSEIFKRHLDDPAGARRALTTAGVPCGQPFGDGWTCDLDKGRA